MKKGEHFDRVKISIMEYEQLEKAEKKAVSSKVLKRIQAFKLMYLGWKYTAVADFLCVSKNTISEWIKLYVVGGVALLTTFNYLGGQAKLNINQLVELQQKASEGNFTFAKEIKEYISKNFSVSYNLKHVQLLAKKKFCYPLRKQN
ncbi:MAG: helix-turn-helix domain-containing protein [Patescibacteria group bacterium]